MSRQGPAAYMTEPYETQAAAVPIGQDGCGRPISPHRRHGAAPPACASARRGLLPFRLSRGRTMTNEVREKIKHAPAIPSVPEVVTRFVALMDDPEFNYDELVRVMSSDPGAVSEVLRLANSALFGLRHRVGSLRHALTMLGPRRTRAVLLGRYLVENMRKRAIAGLDVMYFWRRSVVAVVVAVQLAEQVAPQRREEAFLGSLLAKIGIPILAEIFRDAYGPAVVSFGPNQRELTADEELALVGVSHGEMAAHVLRQWGLPLELCDAVEQHQRPDPSTGAETVVARLVFAGHQIARLLCETPDMVEAERICREAMQLLGLEVRTLADLLPEVEDEVASMAEALHIPVLPAESYSIIARALQQQLSAATVAQVP